MTDYDKAKTAGITKIDRWEEGTDHHQMSERIMEFLILHDLHNYGDHFCWKKGGDGDNGETLMYQLDAFFEMLDQEKMTDELSKEEKILAAFREVAFLAYVYNEHNFRDSIVLDKCRTICKLLDVDGVADANDFLGFNEEETK